MTSPSPFNVESLAGDLRIPVIDSHTGGEPTRVILEGVIDLPGATMADRSDYFAANYLPLGRGLLSGPRGSEGMVGAILTPPVSADATTGVLFFSGAGPLGMCGHGTIGLTETLHSLGRLPNGPTRFDSPVGVIHAERSAAGEIAIQNVASLCTKQDVRVEIEAGEYVGDVAYGGNWFFIVHESDLVVSLENRDELTRVTKELRTALAAQGVTGQDRAHIEHVMILGKGVVSGADTKNFVLCPDGNYDRSPCGTGTSALLACLHARNKLGATPWLTVESITGSTFRGRIDALENGLIPTIVGTAHVTGEATIYLDAKDPLRWGIATR